MPTKKRMAAFLVAVCALAVVACSTFPAGGNEADDLKGKLIVVAGGSGRAGAYVVRRAREQGLTVRALTRNAAQARERLGPDAEGVEWVEVDVRDAAQVAKALQGADMLLSVIGSRELGGPNSAEFVDYGGVKNLVDAAVREKAQRFVLLTAIGASDKDSFANKMFKGALEWRFKGEEYLRASGLGYTVVRPAGLTNEPAGAKGVKLYQGDDWKQHLRKTISRDDLALVLIECLRNPGARNATFEIANEAGIEPGAWRAQLGELKPDSR